ncbi:MAG: DUF721 domain-containing protein [Prevotella sp.]|nr:DUF721 domain-containing protein [Prevotella sp.]
MFKRRVVPLADIINVYLRQEGLETPLLQRRLVEAWDKVVGSMVSRYSVEKYIRNQTLFVKISNPSLRSELSMMRSQIIKRLNEEVGSTVIVDLRLY